MRMTKPALNNERVDTVFDFVASMSEGVRCHVDISQGWAVVYGQAPIFLGNKTNSGSLEWLTIPVEKKGLMLDAMLQVVGDGLHSLLPKRDSTLLTAFAHKHDRAFACERP